MRPVSDEGAGVLIPFEATIRGAVTVFVMFPADVAPITITFWPTLQSHCADGTVRRPNFVMESLATVITVPSVAVRVHMLAMIVPTVLRNAAATTGRA